MIDCFKKILFEEGILAFYKGTLPPMLGSVGINAIVFGVHEYSRKILHEYDVQNQVN
jgi:hypothetical protein